MENEEEPIEEYTPHPEYGTPTSQNLEVTKYLTENNGFIYEEGHGRDDEHVIQGDLPPDMKSYFWAFLGKDGVLTCIRDDRDVQIIMEMLEASIESYEMSLAPGKYTYVTLRHLDNLRKIVRDKVLGAWHQSERRLLATQIQQTLVGEAGQDQPQSGFRKRPGIFSSIFGGGR